MAIALLVIGCLGGRLAASDLLSDDFERRHNPVGRPNPLAQPKPRRGSTARTKADSPAQAAGEQHRAVLRPSNQEIAPPEDAPLYDGGSALAESSGWPTGRPDASESELGEGARGATSNFVHHPVPASAAVQPAVLPEDPESQQLAPLEGAGGANDQQPAKPSGSLPLSPRHRRPGAIPTAGGESARVASRQPALWNTGMTVLTSLALVLGLFFLFAWFMRRGVPRGAPLLPPGVVEVLGRMPMPGRQQLQLLRLGNKLLLVHLSLTGAETLAEIADPEEVDRIAGLCQQQQSHSATRSFHEVLDQLGRERPGRLAEQDYGLELGGGPALRRRGRGRDLDV